MTAPMRMAAGPEHAAKGKVIAFGLSTALAIAAAIIIQWEGVSYQPYQDIGGVWTVCYGHTGADVVLGKTYTRAECDAFLQADMKQANAAVRGCLPVPMAAHMEAAFTSAAFNIGPKVVCGSTLQRKALANDWPGACAELDRWKHAGGREIRGLVLRRADERALCEGRAP
ncbi:MAG TPA: lysozyme [Xylella sp.]